MTVHYIATAAAQIITGFTFDTELADFTPKELRGPFVILVLPKELLIISETSWKTVCPK